MRATSWACLCPFLCPVFAFVSSLIRRRLLSLLSSPPLRPLLLGPVVLEHPLYSSVLASTVTFLRRPPSWSSPPPSSLLLRPPFLFRPRLLLRPLSLLSFVLVSSVLSPSSSPPSSPPLSFVLPLRPLSFVLSPSSSAPSSSLLRPLSFVSSSLLRPASPPSFLRPLSSVLSPSSSAPSSSLSVLSLRPPLFSPSSSSPPASSLSSSSPSSRARARSLALTLTRYSTAFFAASMSGYPWLNRCAIDALTSTSSTNSIFGDAMRCERAGEATRGRGQKAGRVGAGGQDGR